MVVGVAAAQTGAWVGISLCSEAGLWDGLEKKKESQKSVPFRSVPFRSIALHSVWSGVKCCCPREGVREGCLWRQGCSCVRTCKQEEAMK